MKTVKYFEIIPFRLLVIFYFQQAENLCNAIGVLFQNAPPSSFPNFDKNSKTPSQSENTYGKFLYLAN